MTTGELIKLLQKSDPTGNCHIRIGDDRGVIVGVEKKEGYWDGPYSYLKKDDEGKWVWVETTKNSKVDFITMDLFDFAEIYHGDWEEVKKHIIVEYDYLDNERKNHFLEIAKKECDEYFNINSKIYEESYKKMKENALNGWRWFQDKRVDNNKSYTYYFWKIFDENGKEYSSSISMTESVLKSRDWEKVDNNVYEGYYEWIYKNKK